MIRAIAIDDEPPALKVIESFCSDVDFITLEKTFTKPNEALKYLRKFPVDLLFLDVNMPALSGLELYKKIDQETLVVFTTAYPEFAVEGFNLNALDYLLKPFTFERFLQAVTKAKEFYRYTSIATEPAQEQFLFIRADYSLIKITLSDVLYIEGLDDYMKIHLQNQKPIVARMTMKGILEKLPSKEFIRVHRSFIVPFSKIENVRKKNITIEGKEIPIGTSYETDFFSIFKE